MTHFSDPEARVQVVGKQILFDGKHLADAKSEEAAQVIGMALQYAGVSLGALPADSVETLREFLQ